MSVRRAAVCYIVKLKLKSTLPRYIFIDLSPTLFNFKYSNVVYVEMSLYLAVHSLLFHLCSLFMCRKCPVASTWLCLLLSASAGIHSTGREMLRVFICLPTIQCILSAVWQFQPLGVQDNGKVYYSVAAANVFDVYALAKQENNQTSLAKLKLSHLVPHKGLKRHQCSPSFANLWKEVLSECHHCTHMQCCAI